MLRDEGSFGAPRLTAPTPRLLERARLGSPPGRSASRGPRRSRVATRTLGLAALAVLVLATLTACSDAPGLGPTPPDTATEWRVYGGSLERRFFNARETKITKETAPRLVPLWRFLTGAIITASPIIARVDLPGEGTTSIVYVSSWDGKLYALRSADGSLVWSFTYKPHPGASYPQAGSAAVEDIDGRRVIYIGGGMTMYCIDAATGALVWEFNAGTGCTDCDSRTERNEVESSPAVFDGVVYFGMDVNDSFGKGGFYAVDARKGALRWYFDLETSSTCYPFSDDRVRSFDGYHTAAQLGLPADFFATRPGCDFDRSPDECGNVWSSPAVDAKRRVLYTASSNCDVSTNPASPRPRPPMPPYDEAIFALNVDTGTPVWRWRPREIDPDDLAFGAVPNLFEAEIGGARREVVGVGNKDGVYYLLDRDGTNEITGQIEPYWQTKTVQGGSFGGIISSSAVGEGKVLFGTAIGVDIERPQKPVAWGLDGSTGAVIWNDPVGLPGFAPTIAIPGVAFIGNIAGTITAYDSDTGAVLAKLGTPGPVASNAVVVDGRVYVGTGTGERGGNPDRIAFRTSLIPSPLSVFCIGGTEGCPESGNCDDGNTCTMDVSTPEGCRTQSAPDGTTCTLGDISGSCRSGVCFPDVVACPPVGQCTRAISGINGCQYVPELDGTACSAGDAPGTCRAGVCVKL